MTVVVISVVIGIVLILVLSLVVYKVYYNYRANKALNTGVPAKVLSPGSILISLAFVFMVLFNIFLYNEMVFTSNKINTLQLQNNNLIEMIEIMSDDLSEQILDNTKNTYDDIFVYEGLDGDNIIFDLSFKVKSLNNGAIITILVEDELGDIVEYSVTKDELTYSTRLLLDFDEEYNIYIKIVSVDNTFIELVDVINPYDILEARFDVYPIRVRFNNEEFQVTFHNQIGLINSMLEGLQVDYIELYIYNNGTGDSETIRVTNFYKDIEGSNYLGEAVFIEAIAASENQHSKDSTFTAYLTIFDKDGHYYSFEVEPDYTVVIRKYESLD